MALKIARIKNLSSYGKWQNAKTITSKNHTYIKWVFRIFFLRNRKVHIHITCASIIFTCTTFRQSENDICVCWTFNVADLSHIEPLRTSRNWSIIKYLFYACAFPWVMACQSICSSDACAWNCGLFRRLLRTMMNISCTSDGSTWRLHLMYICDATNNALDRHLTDGNNRNRCELLRKSIATCNLIRWRWWIGCFMTRTVH